MREARDLRRQLFLVAKGPGTGVESCALAKVCQWQKVLVPHMEAPAQPEPPKAQSLYLPHLNPVAKLSAEPQGSKVLKISIQ